MESVLNFIGWILCPRTLSEIVRTHPHYLGEEAREIIGIGDSDFIAYLIYLKIGIVEKIASSLDFKEIEVV